jgi:FKBP-type peptidyl-prolyl cis-trans isomerase FkpA
MTMKPTAGRLLVIASLALSACAGSGGKAPAQSNAPGAAAGALQTEEQKTLYAVGLILGQNVKPLALSPAELETVKRGLSDSVIGKAPEVALEAYGPKVQAFAQQRASQAAGAEKGKAAAFAESAAQEQGAVKTASGLVFKTLTPGAGASPAATDTVKVHYRGTLTDGTEFDSSIKRGQPVEFPLSGVIPCWTEGVQKMKIGEKARLVCPSGIAYGDQGRPPVIPGGATLVFEVELLSITKKAPAGAAPQAAPKPKG